MSDEGPSEEAADVPAGPVLRIVKGDPTAEELAALVSVVAARNAAADEQAERASKRRTRSAWGDPALATRPVMRVGPGGWRRSAFPG
ncbi:MAG: acyl-CoA carboxylase subunit epsilon [Nocardioidaceae bacterium]